KGRHSENSTPEEGKHLAFAGRGKRIGPVSRLTDSASESGRLEGGKHRLHRHSGQVSAGGLYDRGLRQIASSRHGGGGSPLALLEGSGLRLGAGGRSFGRRLGVDRRGRHHRSRLSPGSPG